MMVTGDCLEWLRSLPDDHADQCITDPPYSEHVHAKSFRSDTNRRGKKRAPVKRDLGFTSLTPALMDDVASELARVTRRWVLVFCNIELAPGWWWALRGAGLDYVRTMAWDKTNAAPQFSGDRPAHGWEAIVLCHRPGPKSWNGGGRRGVFTGPMDIRGERVHSTEKPVWLMLELVRLFSDPGELVIDPFAGSASTGVASIRLGRRFAGAELDPNTAAIARERLQAETQNLSLSAARAGQLGMFAAPPDGPMVVP